MRYLHTMLRVRNLDRALDFYCNKLGLKEVRRRVDEKSSYTLVFLAGPEDEPGREKQENGREAPLVELTYNWDSEDYGEARYFGHLAYEVDDIYALCERLMQAGVTINRPPRDGNDGVRALARQAFDRAVAERRAAAAAGALDLDAEYREMVRQSSVLADSRPLYCCPAKRLYISPASSALRLAVQDAALSRRKHGFDSRRARH